MLENDENLKKECRLAC